MRWGIVAFIGVLTVASAWAVTGTNDTFSAPQPEQPRYVSITFDDGYASQYDAAQELEDRGWNGVFFVSADTLNGTFDGLSTMTRLDVQTLARSNHEIGGHTYTHTNLSAVNASTAQQEFDRNRDALRDLGIQPTSFAYPHGEVAHRNTVMNRYTYARGAGWEIESVPPRQPDQITTIALTEDNHDVLDAYLNRLDPGEWLVISLHHVGDNAVERGHVDMTQDTYESVLDRVAAANATVVTFEDMQDVSDAS